MYKLQNDSRGEVCAVSIVHDNGSVSSIPLEPANTDYIAYLAWIAEGNTPEEA